MLQSQTKEIDGLTFEVTQLDVKSARSVLVRLTKLCAPALAELAKGTGESFLDTDASVVVGAFARLLNQASEEDLEFLCAAFMKKSMWQPPQATNMIQLTDIAFQGRLSTMFKWIWFAIEVNYSDFLDGLGAIKPLLSPVARTQ